MDPDVGAVILCLLGSAFFSASETALTALPVTRLEALRERSGRLTRAGLDCWATDPQHLLITILVGNNLVNVLASALATSIAFKVSENHGVAMVVGIMTLVILVFGEITPKTLAQKHAQAVAARVVPIIYVLDVVIRPVNRVLGLLTRVLSRGDQKDRLPVTEEDLLFMLRLAHRHAQLAPEARLMMESVLRLHHAVAREVMLPRPRVSTVDGSWDLGRVQEAVAGSDHSRFPVVAGSPDDIVGVLHAKHLMRLRAGQPWRELMVEPLFVPESRKLPDLLQDFRKSGQHLAIVLDEFGGCSGVVTLEDLLELVVGEIEDEFDGEPAILATEGGWLVPAHLALRRLERVLNRTLDTPEDIDSAGGLVVHLARENEQSVAVGFTTNWDDLTLEVREISGDRPFRILIRQTRPE